MIALVLLTQAAGWSPVPLVSATQRAAGFRGGEGCQWLRSLVAAPDNKFGLIGTDVGGLYRTLDGGATWSPANVGYTPRGTSWLAIDPGNPDRVISVGANSTSGKHHGLWLSENRAASWRQVVPVDMSGSYEGERDQVAFDPATYSATAKRTQVVYWSRIEKDAAHWGTPEQRPALWKSRNGGRTWTELPNSADFGGSWLKCHPKRAGMLFAGNARGLWISTDGAKTFRRAFADAVTGLDVSPAAPDTFYALLPQGLRVSTDAGVTWRSVDLAEIHNGQDVFRNVRVSPKNPRNLVLWRDAVPNNWNWPRFASQDGGRTWRQSTLDATGSFMPTNSRQGFFAFWPDGRVMSAGGDYVSESRDRGVSYRYRAQGYNGILVGGALAFHPTRRGLVFFGSQDYNGAFTRDSGRTWTYTNPAGNGWGGFCYGGVAITDKTFVVGNAGGWGNPRFLRRTTDGGATWSADLMEMKGVDAGFVDPTRPAVAFAGDLRTADSGANWTRMAGCSGVYAAGGGRLYGVVKSGGTMNVVVSADRGVTWTPFGPANGDIRDVATDGTNVYAVFGDRAGVVRSSGFTEWATPKNQWGGWCARTVAVDPKNPKRIAVGSAGNWMSTSRPMVLSEDAGRTWRSLSRDTALAEGAVDGGREVICARFDPFTGDLWAATSCYGIWRWR